MKEPLISIVVIGRNEGSHLERLFVSLQPLRSRWPCETLFVDSASVDDSARIAATLFDQTLVLEESACLNASAGRYAGVWAARGRWALFLDGDMEFQPDCMPELEAFFGAGREDRGAIGSYVHRYSDGSQRTWKPPVAGDGFVSHFGGAVLLPLSALREENWDPRLYSNEEIELHTRLRCRGVRVQRLEAPFIGHFTARFTFMQKLCGNFWPKGSYLGKKFFGVGQMLRASAGEGRLMSLARGFPEPFVLWGCLVAALVAALVGMPWIALVLAVAGVAFVTLRRALTVVVGYVAFLPQALFGFRHFHRDWKPRVVQRIFREEAPRVREEVLRR